MRATTARLKASKQALGAEVCYAGSLFWGFTADPEVVPDLAALPGLVQASFSELAEAAELGGGGDTSS